MNHPTSPAEDVTHLPDDGTPETGGTFFSTEVIAELAGVDTTTVLTYQAQGYIRPVKSDAAPGLQFDIECLRQLRRIGHLRTTCGVNENGLRLLLHLLEEVEKLKEERRRLMR